MAKLYPDLVPPMVLDVNVMVNGSLYEAREQFMRHIIFATHLAFDGRVGHMAAALDVHRNTMTSMIHRYMPKPRPEGQEQ